MTRKFLSRVIQEDRKGLFFHIGGSRYRPFTPRETRYKNQEKVFLTPRNEHPRDNAYIVFQNPSEEFEIWNVKDSLARKYNKD